MANAIAQIATGRSVPVMSQAADPNEERKRLMGLLVEVESLICLDNIEKSFSSDTLCSVLTMPVLKDRILGKTQMISAPTNALFLATGNNVEVVGNLTRRVLPCRIDPEVERPQERKFTIHLPSYVKKNRPQLVQAALTIMRVYHMAGRPPQAATEFGSFEQWSDWVRGALLWTGMADPNLGLQRIERADPVRRELACMLEAWYATFRNRTVTGAQVIEKAKKLEQNSHWGNALKG